MLCTFCNTTIPLEECITSDCCSFTICKRCFHLDNVPNCTLCRKPLVWVNKEAEIKTLKIEIKDLKYEIRNLKCHLEYSKESLKIDAEYARQKSVRQCISIRDLLKRNKDLEAYIRNQQDEQTTESLLPDVIHRLNLIMYNPNFQYKHCV